MKYAFLALMLLSACTTAPEVESGPMLAPVPNVKRVFIEAINFYSDRKFTKPAPPHWYMDTSRNEIRKLAREQLPSYGFTLADMPDPDGALRLTISICIGVSPVGISSYINTKVYYREYPVLEITGNYSCGSFQLEDIQRAQKEMAEALIRELVQRLTAGK